jgi:hypothetical protein
MQGPLQKIVNRTRWLKDRIESFFPSSGADAGEYLYPAPFTRTFTVDLFEGVPHSTAGVPNWGIPGGVANSQPFTVGANTRKLLANVGRYQYMVPLNKYLRHGQYLISLEVMAKPGADPGAGNRMQFGLYRTPDLNYSSPANPGAPTNIIGVEIAGTAVVKATATVVGTVVVLRRGDTARDYFAVVESGNHAGQDELYSMRVTVSDRRVGNS